MIRKSFVKKAAIACLFIGAGFVANAQSITGVEPSTSQTFNYTETPSVRIYASSGVSYFGEVSLTYGDTHLVLADSNTTLFDPESNPYGVSYQGPSDNVFLQIGGESYPAFLNLLGEIAAAGGSFTLTVTDLMTAGTPVQFNTSGLDGVTVSNGTVNVTYSVIPAPKYQPDESIWPSKFMSYWEPGDPDGIAILSFSMPIANVNNISLTMGFVDPTLEVGNDFNVYVDIPYEVDGDKVIIDFTGQEWCGDQKEVTVKVSNVVGTNGMNADFTGYSVSRNVLYEYLPYYKVGEHYPGGDNPGDGPSGVNTIKMPTEKDSSIYTLDGVKITEKNLRKGIYVVGGKKVLIK